MTALLVAATTYAGPTTDSLSIFQSAVFGPEDIIITDDAETGLSSFTITGTLKGTVSGQPVMCPVAGIGRDLLLGLYPAFAGPAEMIRAPNADAYAIAHSNGMFAAIDFSTLSFDKTSMMIVTGTLANWPAPPLAPPPVVPVVPVAPVAGEATSESDIVMVSSKGMKPVKVKIEPGLAVTTPEKAKPPAKRKNR